mgnify:CR=1 FL=1
MTFISNIKINSPDSKTSIILRISFLTILTDYSHSSLITHHSSLFTIGENFFIGYSPERVDPGNKNFTTKTIPKVVSGHTKNCLELTKILYDQIVDQTTGEDYTFTYTLSADDVDSNSTEFEYTALLDGNGSVSVDGGTLMIVPDSNYNGEISVSVTVSDGQLTDSGSFTLTVDPVNDAPVLADIQDVFFDEDSSTQITLLASDIDQDALTFSITGGDAITADLLDNTITFTAVQHFNGSEEFTLSVSDADYTDAQSILVTVNPVNDAPVAEDGSGLTDEDESVDIALIASDLDGDVLTYLLDQDSADGFVSITGSTATFTPDENFNGPTSFTYRVTDGELTSNIATITIDVTPVNDAPVLDVVAEQSIDEDNTFTYILSANDVDNTALEYTASLDGNGSVSVDGSILNQRHMK